VQMIDDGIDIICPYCYVGGQKDRRRDDGVPRGTVWVPGTGT
jgi:hypothetical protein